MILAGVAAVWWLGSWALSAWRKESIPHMNKLAKIGVVVAVAAAVVLVVVLKQRPARLTAGENPKPQAASGLPRLVDLGAGMCIPCKLMAPILEELKKEFAGRLEVVFIDVNEDKEAVEKYKINVIPVQIFLDPSGKELFRHEGFFSKEDILAKWKELGFDFSGGGAKAKEGAALPPAASRHPDEARGNPK